MATAEERNKQPEIQYDFFDPALWTARIGSIDNALDATVHVLRDVLVTLDGFSLAKLTQLMQAAGGEDYTQLVADLIATPGAQNRQRLIDQVTKDIGKEGTKPFWFLNNMLLRYLEADSLALTGNQPTPGIADFEIKQLLNLYMLWNALNNFFWTPVVNLMQRSLAEHKTAQTLAPLHLIREAFRYVALDIEIIQRALVQRRRDLPGAGDYATPLLVMDKLALKAVAPIAHRLTDHTQVNVITFLCERTHIHHLPYTDQFILIGLSYDRISQDTYYPGLSPAQKEPLPSFELMAIPHEVGHYVYHNAHLKSKETFADRSESFKDNRYYRWCEEIFADTYGCMVAGALSGLGLQALLVSSDTANVWKDDEEHPTPAVRPYILSQILRVLSEKQADRYQFAKVADRLDENWSAILQQKGYTLLDMEACRPLRIKLPGQSDDYLEQIVNIDTLLTAIQPIINEFVRLLISNVNFIPWATAEETNLAADIPWSRGDVTSLKAYDRVMAALTSGGFAAKNVPSHTIIDAHYSTAKIAAPTTDEQLQRCIQYWGDSGPHGWGEH